jgi:hypothetical protein
LPCGVLQLDELGDSLIALVLVLSALGHNGGVILARELPACVGIDATTEAAVMPHRDASS